MCNCAQIRGYRALGNYLTSLQLQDGNNNVYHTGLFIMVMMSLLKCYEGNLKKKTMKLSKL